MPALARFSRRRRPPANRRVESRAFAIRSEPGRRPRQFVRFAPLRAESTIRTRGSRTSPQCSSWRLSVSKVRRRLNGQLRSLYFLHPTSVIGSGTCTRSRGLAPKPRAQSQPQQLRAARQASLSRGLTFSPVLFQRLLSGGAFFWLGASLRHSLRGIRSDKNYACGSFRGRPRPRFGICRSSFSTCTSSSSCSTSKALLTGAPFLCRLARFWRAACYMECPARSVPTTGPTACPRSRGGCVQNTQHPGRGQGYFRFARDAFESPSPATRSIAIVMPAESDPLPSFFANCATGLLRYTL